MNTTNNCVGTPVITGADSTTRRGTVLVVDDSPTAQRVIRQVIEAGGYRVLLASDGDEALEVAARACPELVVLDIILPKKNGFQVCRQLKSDSQTAGIKVVLLSSKAHEMDILWGRRQGADGYLTKPFESAELLMCIDEVLSRSAEPAAVSGCLPPAAVS